MRRSLRIVGDGPVGHNVRVLYQPDIDPDDWFASGEPVDISHVFSDAAIRITPGEINRANLTAIAIGCDLEVSPRQMAVRMYRPRAKVLRWLGYR